MSIFRPRTTVIGWLTQPARHSLRVFVLAAASPVVRGLLLLVFLIVAGWLMFDRAWQPLTAPAPLPAGVSEEDPQLDVDQLQAMVAQRTERVARPALPLGQATTVFSVPAPPDVLPR